MSLNAFVTLITSDAYVPGAVVAIRSILQAEGANPAFPFETVCLVTPATLAVQSIKTLRKNFSLVVGVEELRSGFDRELNLLGRQDLASTLTKLHLFRLVQFRKVIFVDADTLCLQPLSHLFALDAPFSAAPDAGWPDCFNSGMFVATPSAETFDSLVNMSTERGSWDGGDQGLLNDFFEDWNRLSFTYNVTPSAYYTYAPAYRRHGDKIKVVHFIGQHKPWHEAGPSRSVPSSSEDGGSHDYASLLNKWFAVYQRYFAADAATVSTKHFTFPQLAATWDAPGAPAPYVPPSLEDLKKTFLGVYASRPGQGQAQSSQQKRTSFLIDGSDIEGHYVSMPLKPGRPDLLQTVVFRSKAPTPPPTQAAAASSSEDRSLSPSPPSASGSSAPQRGPSPPPSGPAGDAASAPPPSVTVEAPSPRPPSPERWSPPVLSWDPARSEPPKNDKPQMAFNFDQQYENIWDGPRSSSQRAFFNAPSAYHAIPKVTHQNYDQVTKAHSPDSSKIKPVFPWESQAQAPTRRFPQETQARPVASSSGGGHQQSQPSPSSGPSSHHSQQQQQQQQQRRPPAYDIANLTSHYTNAWDDVPAIRKYAESMNPRSPHRQQHQQHSGTTVSGGGHSRSASHAAHSRGGSHHHHHHPGRLSREGSINESPRKAAASSTGGGGYDTGGEASSRDGDDEDEEDEDDDGQSRPSQSYTSKAAKASRSPVPSSSRPLSTAGGRGSAVSPPSASSSSMGRSDSFQNMQNLTAVAAAAAQASANSDNGSLQPPLSGRLTSSSRTSSAETVTPSSQHERSSSHGGLPDTSRVAYVPQRVSRVFDSRTDTEHIKKEGLEALHRFVRSMEAKGAALNANASGQRSNGNGNGTHQ